MDLLAFKTVTQQAKKPKETSAFSAIGQLRGELRCVVSRCEVPVHQIVQESFDEFRTQVAVVDVVSVFPNVNA